MTIETFPGPKKTSLDKDLKKIGRLQKAGRKAGLQSAKLGLALAFLLIVLAYTTQLIGEMDAGFYIVVAGVVGAYMAMNIGANDVANTMGPAVGAKTLTIFWALVIATVFNVLGALVAGGNVVKTVSKGIIDIGAVPSTDAFIWVMIAALLAAALWVNFATYVGAPVSTTHSIVGGVMGSGIAAAGVAAVNWPVMGRIAASWVISPLLGGALAAIILFAIKTLILYREDRIGAAKRWVPVFVSIMAAIFSVYLSMKGLKRIWKPDTTFLMTMGLVVFAASYLVLRPIIRRAAAGLANKRKSVARLFTIPLIFSTALLAFAHGANDVANAVGPLAGVIAAVASGGVQAKVGIPGWVLVVGGFGIALGIGLFGPKLIRTVGEKVTKLNTIRAYSVALAAAITVIVASALGLPVSSTHVAVGGIFGVGLLREYLANRKRWRTELVSVAAGPGPNSESGEDHKVWKKVLKKARKRRLVRRQFLYGIAAAWVITVPCSALLSAFFYFALRGMMLP